ncbi:hypothetical protein [uncultured Sphingomonas sp.]|uniref:hypothetical protein n=1 Tax=uncultured Sphingomonas sp. TaxID=158754 RepID=UPI0025F6A224|nr:hypothetical protein [uncultured Sphingomonas sp.]
MRDLRTAELNAVSGGTFGCFSWLFACKPKVSYCKPEPKCDPAPKCEPKPKKGCR